MQEGQIEVSTPRSWKRVIYTIESSGDEHFRYRLQPTQSVPYLRHQGWVSGWYDDPQAPEIAAKEHIDELLGQ